MSKRHAMIIAAGVLASASALAQTETVGQAGQRPATAGTVPAAANPAHAPAPRAAPSASASTPEGRSAAALAMTHEPTYDEGSAQRIRDAALSYSDIAVRGGWPEIPAEAKFAPGVQGANDENMNFGFSQRYVVVNIPAAFAEAVENDVVVRRYRVIVGKTEKPSPTLTAQITSVVLNPTWTVPSSIAKTEISAHMRKDPTLSVAHAHGGAGRPRQSDRSAFGRLVGHAHAELHGAPAQRQLQRAGRGEDRHAERLLGLHARHQPAQSVQRRLSPLSAERSPERISRLRKRSDQRCLRPGPRGCGETLPGPPWTGADRHDDAAHDRGDERLRAEAHPAARGFAAAARDSHGCSRVDNVRDLAAWLLKDQPKWSRAAIDAEIASGQHLDVAMAKRVPVAWIYLTAWMTRDQTIQFRSDVYHQDEQLLEATAEEAAFFSNAGSHPLTAHMTR